MIGELIKIKPEELPARRGKKKRFFRRTWFKVLVLGSLILALAGWIGMQIYLQPLRERAGSFDLTKVTQLEESSIIYDRNHKEIGRMANENRRLVAFSELPQNLIETLLATEDSRFWDHHGIDYYGVARAFVWNALNGKNTQGASTITQQLARQTFDLFEKSYQRKIVEGFIAERIEKVYTKPQIIELYLNKIYFGSGFYGIESAAQGYFSKPASALTREESAVIVGLIKNPGQYNPISGKENLTLRERNKVYDRLVDVKIITDAEAVQLKAKPLVINPSQDMKASGYVQQEVQKEVDRILSDLGFEGISGKGFKIHTTIDSEMQMAAEESVKKRLSEIEKLPQYPKAPGRETPAQYEARLAAIRATNNPAARKPETAYLQAAALAMENRTGHILAMVGGRDFQESQFNRVTLSKRPAGTVFVPFVYATAFEGDYFPGSRLLDKKMDVSRIMLGATTGLLGEWGCEAVDAVHKNEIAARQALMEGKNNSAARLGLELGVDKVVNFAKRAGLGDIPADAPSLLGKGETSIPEMCLAYSTFPNGGIRPATMAIVTRIENQEGLTIYQRPVETGMLKVTDPITAFMVHSCLEDTLAIGTGAPAKDYGLKDFPAIAGKTGTHINSTDLWFAGYDSAITCVVWAGLDRPETVYPDAFGNRVAEPIWVDIMNASLVNHPAAEISAPKDIGTVELCYMSGELATDSCLEDQVDPNNPGRMKRVKSSYLEYIRPGVRITRHCSWHTGEHDGSTPVGPLVIQAPRLGPTPGGINVDDLDSSAVAVHLTEPTVIGEDPYQAIAGFGAPETPVEEDKSKKPREDVMPTMPVPSFDPAQDILTPRPGKATLDE